MSAKALKLSRPHGQPVERCACGLIPGISEKHAGPVRLFKIACRCGAKTEETERLDDAIADWNDARQEAQARAGVSTS